MAKGPKIPWPSTKLLKPGEETSGSNNFVATTITAIMPKTFKIILKVLGIIAVIVVATKLLLPDVSSPGFKSFVEGQGILGPLAIIGYTIVSHIVAPLVGSPVTFLSIALFGAVKSMLFLYIACMISACINFYISRKLGRKWVGKLAGEGTMNDIDRFLGVSGIGVLVVSRIFCFALFDIIS